MALVWDCGCLDKNQANITLSTLLRASFQISSPINNEIDKLKGIFALKRPLALDFTFNSALDPSLYSLLYYLLLNI